MAANSIIQLHVNRAIHILVIEANPLHQVLIDSGLRLSSPRAKPTLVTTLAAAIHYLHQCATSQLAPPKLVMLGVDTSLRESDWQLLRELRTRYCLLPVLILSAYVDPDFIRQVYDLGAHSFIAKPRRPKEWELQLKSLAFYWLEIVTLPRAY